MLVLLYCIWDGCASYSTSVFLILSVLEELSVEWFGDIVCIGFFTGNKQVFFFATVFEVWQFLGELRFCLNISWRLHCTVGHGDVRGSKGAEAPLSGSIGHHQSRFRLHARKGGRCCSGTKSSFAFRFLVLLQEVFAENQRSRTCCWKSWYALAVGVMGSAQPRMQWMELLESIIYQTSKL